MTGSKKRIMITILNNLKEQLAIYKEEKLKKQAYLIYELHEDIKNSLNNFSLNKKKFITYLRLLKKYNLLYCRDYLTFGLFSIDDGIPDNPVITYQNKILFNHETINKNNNELINITLKNNEINYEVITSKEFYMAYNISAINKTTGVIRNTSDIVKVKRIVDINNDISNDYLEIHLPKEIEKKLIYAFNLSKYRLEKDKIVLYQLTNNLNSNNLINSLYNSLTKLNYQKVYAHRLIDNLSKCYYDELPIDDFFLTNINKIKIKEETDIINNLKDIKDAYTLFLNQDILIKNKSSLHNKLVKNKS